MAEGPEDLHSFTSIMDALVRISVRFKGGGGCEGALHRKAGWVGEGGGSGLGMPGCRDQPCVWGGAPEVARGGSRRGGGARAVSPLLSQNIAWPAEEFLVLLAGGTVPAPPCPLQP